MSSNVSIFIAFGAGLVSFFSPCILPLIPSYLTLLLGNYAEQDNRKTSILPALFFITGFTITFIILGLSVSLLGKLLLKNLSFFRKLSGIIVLILGVHLTGIINLSFLQQNKDLQIPAETNRYLRGLVMGFALAFAWTPCIGPILSSILIYAGTGQTVMQGGVLLTFYASGLALPFFLAAVFINRLLPYFKKINPYLPLIQKISGGLIIILGILIYFGHL
ncbi:cytochrome c biogenesis protein CcdA [Iocasia frigidifontis]|uniref:Cytochrome c biogenesis protein CcdA n=1 Tax=Iocasia fonsfrigidae TaxID=2682810 RepID=A0A8A7K6N2_9FIRM|nr:cytochrome c biogenesis CcdA family protein [Iocasia fonsfrigidae]QTL96830.1 cytochrome c biogenesis protein CcdA [Iocasia fonsfrigidae]